MAGSSASAPPPAPDGQTPLDYLRLLPDFTNQWEIAMGVFVMPIAVQGWATCYPGAEPGGGSHIAQRMLASKSERDSLGAVLFFNVAPCVLRPWPWILVGLCSLIVYPKLSDIQQAFPRLDPALPGHNIAYPAMLKFLPVGFMGLMIGGLTAVHSSTILTHLNWGASYLVHDFYRRFVRRRAPEKHQVLAGRVTSVALFLCSAGMVYLMDTAKDNFDIILQVGAGTGLLYLLRWYWWRITAWCEVVATVSSCGISLVLLFLRKQCQWALPTHHALLLTVAVTTFCRVLAAFLGPQTDRRVPIEFDRKVRPFGPGWRRIRHEAGLGHEEASGTREKIPPALLGWSAGCTTIWASLFAVGNFLYGRIGIAFGLLALFAGSGGVLLHITKRLWRTPPGTLIGGHRLMGRGAHGCPRSCRVGVPRENSARWPRARTLRRSSARPRQAQQ